MITNLYIKNFALIDELELNLNRGLNILAGETGAGKSIIIDAIDAAFGARISKEQIKSGEKKAIIELTVKLSDEFNFELLKENEIELEDQNTLNISREITTTSSKSRVNGVIVTQSYIQNIRKYLIDIHSQHETYTYINPKTHLSLLDEYGNNLHKTILSEFKALYREYDYRKKQLEQIKAGLKEKKQKIDFLNFQIEEILSAKIKNPTELDELNKEREILINAEELKNTSYESYKFIYGKENSIIDILSSIEKKINKITRYDETLETVSQAISSAKIELKDVAETLMDYSENIEADTYKLEQTEERINLLEKLTRKYGPELNDVIENFNNFQKELDEITISDEEISKLEKELNITIENLFKKSEELTLSRKGLAKTLSSLIQQEIIKLEMPQARFLIQLQKKEQISLDGFDEVEFMISTNPGEDLKPLAKVASGGEISRVMLGMKTVFARADKVNTVIFDEIDTGISGKTSQAVAEELASLSTSHQILCITHQPIIAAMSDEHLFVEKVQTADSTKVTVKELNKEEKIKALAKLASGSETNEESVKFAQNLLLKAEQFKKSL